MMQKTRKKLHHGWTQHDTNNQKWQLKSTLEHWTMTEVASHITTIIAFTQMLHSNAVRQTAVERQSDTALQSSGKVYSCFISNKTRETPLDHLCFCCWLLMFFRFHCLFVSFCALGPFTRLLLFFSNNIACVFVFSLCLMLNFMIDDSFKMHTDDRLSVLYSLWLLTSNIIIFIIVIR